jgi:hypothetical protein
MRNIAQYPEPLQIVPNELCVINGPKSLAPDSATCVFIAAATLEADCDDFTSVDGCDALDVIILDNLCILNK